jgi:hypothetical protein
VIKFPLPPNDHFSAGPDCGVIISAMRHTDDAGGYPRIGAWIISPAGAQIMGVALAIDKIPAQTIISLPVQTPVEKTRPSGALVVLVAVQLSETGVYLAPVFK